MGTSDHDPLSADDRRWLDRISTNSMAVHDAGQFVLRYGPAIRAYCESLLPRPHEVDDVLQDLLVRVVERGFPSVDASKGRFRDYLKATVRNAVMTHLRRPATTRYRGLSGNGIAEEASVPSADESAADRAWIDQCADASLTGPGRFSMPTSANTLTVGRARSCGPPSKIPRQPATLRPSG